jgi:hypothetical protein
VAISFTRYIDITSGVGGAGAVKARDLILRVFTTNPLVPALSFVEFETAAEVESYFGSTSEEYLRAAPYFGFVSKQITSPDKISFARWTNVAVAPYAIGDATETDTLAQLQAITAGEMTITINGVTEVVTGINFSTDLSLAAVATSLQAKLVAAGFVSATVAYNAIPGNFEITGGTVGTAGGTISFASDSAETVSLALGFLSPNVIISPGNNVETIPTTLQNSVNASTNFASFVFTNAANLTLQQVEAAAAWNMNNNPSVDFVFLVQVTAANAAAWSAALAGYEGTTLALAPLSTEFPESTPAKVAAATNYANRNASSNYSFQVDSSLTPSVTDDTDANTYDGLSINYYGQTQINGQEINFWQTGVMMGTGNAVTVLTDYYNEIWLKGTIGNLFMSALLALNQIAANASGKATCMNILQQAVAQGVFNGVISVSEELTTTQIAYIVNLANAKAAQQVATIGYWYDVTFSSVVNNAGKTVYQANYILIYAKENVINKVLGSHVLI